MEQCNNCQQFATRYEISFPGQLREVIVKIKKAIRDGLLEEITTERKLSKDKKKKFKLLNEEGPWSDCLSYKFRCTSCGKQFHLNAETYHGRGGDWNTMEEA